MQIPQNVIHWYIGIPILFIAAAYGFKQSQKGQNVINLLLAYGAAIFCLALIVYGIPPLFITDPHALTTTVIIGDILQFCSMALVWLVAVRAFVDGKTKTILATVGVVALTFACSVVSIVENRANPAHLVTEAGKLTYELSFGRAYLTATAIDYFALVIVGAYFWRQSSLAQKSIQKWRVRAFSSFFLLMGIVFAILPFVNVSSNGGSLSNLFIGAFLLMAAMTLGIVIAGRKKTNN